jgi:hypothetical protein
VAAFFKERHYTMNAELQLDRAIRQMFETHPHPVKVSANEIVECIRACVVCATTCTACADACLAEEMVKELAQCIRTNLDCADLCQATGHILVRQTESNPRLMAQQVKACQAACRECATICEQHAKMHEHCRVCAETCRQCEQACANLLAMLPN